MGERECVGERRGLGYVHDDGGGWVERSKYLDLDVKVDENYLKIASKPTFFAEVYLNSSITSTSTRCISTKHPPNSECSLCDSTQAGLFRV